ncbi:hypothetical protein PG994_009112 [Apiospora phragmitis]|uniref:Mso1 N-terminal domain-containing protein n=1 Tax=Apiospora phragmitis TaxID=2905665 RepID=A0ABR1UIC8_9PEZI
MSWYSNILTTTTSRINNLQRTFLGGETDGDTEDDTHVCRILRGYYTEKGRPFPGWLPPDPKAPAPVQPVASQPGQVGARYGGLTQQQGSGSLSSLWRQQPDSQSLRRGRGAPPAARGGDQRLNPFGGRNSDPMAGAREEIQARPLPSQRAGSYQQAAPGRDAPPSSGGGSAQDRLRQRLWGGSRTASPAGSGPFQPPQAQQQQSSHRGGGGGGSGGGSGDYEDRFAPGGMYDGGSGDLAGGGGGGRPGLPSGPRRGLPGGPRMR